VASKQSIAFSYQYLISFDSVVVFCHCFGMINLTLLKRSKVLFLGICALSAPLLAVGCEGCKPLELEREPAASAGYMDSSVEANTLFNETWAALASKQGGEENIHFPKKILWLTGAPGAGKGYHSPAIMEYSGITSEPIVTSDLLRKPEFMERINSGLLINDRVVVEELFNTLMEPGYQAGCIIDGFPRTMVQAEIVTLMYEKLKDSGVAFYVILLDVNEDLSMERQLSRGRKAVEHNKRVQETGVGELITVRATDVDETYARKRFEIFLEQSYSAFEVMRKQFPFNDIDASAPEAEIKEAIRKEVLWQEGLNAGYAARN